MLEATAVGRVAWVTCLSAAIAVSGCAATGSANESADASVATPPPVASPQVAMRIALPTTRDAAPPYAPTTDADGVLVARNVGHRLTSRFLPGGVSLTHRAASSDAVGGVLRLANVGRIGAMRAITDIAPTASGDRVRYARGAGWTEWYQHGPAGMEQGFDVAERPSGDGVLRIEMETPGWTPVERVAGETIELRDAGGRGVFGYGRAHAVDAKGHDVPVSVGAADGAIVLTVRDDGATYPIAIDPTMWGLLQEITGSDTVAGDQFGEAVAVLGTTAVVTAPGQAGNKGAAYVFVRSGSTWMQQSKLLATGGAAGDNFGWSAAFNGTTALIGAYGVTSNTGAVYAFTQSGTTWSQTAKLTATDAAAGAYFGGQLSVSGPIAIIGASSSNATGNAYIFVQSGTAWSQQAELVGSDSVSGDVFGYDVSINGFTALVGAEAAASGEGVAYIFARTGTAWSQQAKLAANDASGDQDQFGTYVSLSGSIAAIGAPNRYETTGATYIFTGSGSSWMQQVDIAGTTASNGQFGSRVAVNGTTLVAGTPGAGLADIFTQSGTTWTEQTALSGGPDNGMVGDAVGFDGNTVILGSAGNDKAYLYDYGTFATNGTSCTSGAQCASGSCTEGVCCNEACGTCRSCLASRNGSTGGDGTCLPLPAYTSDPGCGTTGCYGNVPGPLLCNGGGYCDAISTTTPSCAPYACNAAATGCSTSCTADTDCFHGNYCASGICVSQRGTGAACAANDQCSSGNCTSGLCTASNGVYCTAGGQCTSGFCTNNVCCTTSSCASGFTCQGVAGEAIAGGPPGTCVDTGCDAAGSTQVCDATATPTSENQPWCTNGVCCPQTRGAACPTGQACNNPGAIGRCTLGLGATCPGTGTCSTGMCTNGVCCSAASCGACGTCDGTTPGTCTPLAQHATPASSCGDYLCNGASTTCPTSCSGDSDCLGTAWCSGGKCVNQGALGATCTGNDQCASGSCTNGVCCSAATCGACGTCGGASPGSCTALARDATPASSCGAYLCGGSSTSCATSCGRDGDCIGGDYCNASGVCTPQAIDSATCTANDQCASGFCTNGVCCGVASCGTGSACNVSGHAGSCAKVGGTTCSVNTDCGSGFCVDGVCCDTACAGECQACDVSGSAGTCTTVVGAPHGSRAACGGTGAGTSCGAVCNGTDAAACHAPGSSQSCGIASCSGNAETNLGTCNGAGVCSQVSTPCNGYACGGSTCKTSCSAGSDCQSGFYCSGGACLPVQGLGSTCASGGACATGLCTNNVCCGSASCGACGTCNGSNPGTCTAFAHDATPVSSCGSYLCNGTTTSCPSGCAKDADCVAGDYCNSSGQCAAQGVLGIACTAGDQCGSGDCTNGVCCSAASCGACGTCNGTAAGTCTPLAVDATPSGSCGGYLCDGSDQTCSTSCNSDADCIATDYCNGSGQCVAKLALTTTCSGSDQCGSGNCVDSVCCSTASCPSGSGCNVAGHAGTCIERTGTACTAASQCGSGFCVDGYCCNVACAGECQACDVSGSAGTCTAVLGAPHGTRTACDSLASTACGHTICDGTHVASCNAYANGPTVTCAPPSCSAANAIGPSKCDGAGNCVAPASISCAPYTCASGLCQSDCAVDTDCNAGAYCDASTGACTPKSAVGSPCGTASDQCASGACVDGVCCSTASCASGSACNVAGSLGTCIEKAGTACTKGSDCGSGYCVDGVCCNTACTGECEACDASGNGTCTPIVGAPHNTPLGPARAACSTGGANVCAATTCDGVTVASCTGYANGATTTCGVPTCSGSNVLPAPTCSGTGNCGSGTAVPCAPFGCNAASGACNTSCTVDGDCAMGFFCGGGTCQSTGASGAPCTGNDQCASGFCTNAVCCGVADCGTGNACNIAGHLGSCVRANGATCTAATDCGSGNCVDGFCCDTSCTDDCEACDVAGHSGTCTPVVGAPHGSRPTCDTLASTDCARKQCDGTTTATCQGYANTTSTPCGAAACNSDATGSIGIGACDGLGDCKAPTATLCLPFKCEANVCASSCAADTDCATGYTCNTTSGTCVQGATCSADGTSTVNKSGVETSCSPYLCVAAGSCGTACAETADCAGGFTCIGGVCTTVSSGGSTASKGGCAVASSGAGEREGGFAGVLVGALAVLGARRRRAR